MIEGDRYSIQWQYGNMGAIVPIRSSNDALFAGGSGACSSGKKRLKFSEVQSSAFWTLKLSKCLDSILNK